MFQNPAACHEFVTPILLRTFPSDRFSVSIMTPPVSFRALGLSQWIVDACERMGIGHPTEIQQKCIPEILSGADVIGRAETGSGKTLAFALPMLEILSRDPFAVFGVVLTSGRELAIQIAEQFTAIGASMSLKCCVIIGGLDQTPQTIALIHRPHIIIATPGRLADHLRLGSGSLHLSNVQFLVLDEADRLLEPHFADDLQCITESIPSCRQTLLFSATLSDSVRQFSSKPCIFDSASRTEFITCQTLTQQYVFVPQMLKDCALFQLIKNSNEKPNFLVIVFVARCQTAEIICEMLTQLEINCVGLHSKLGQRRRMASLGKFRSGRASVLVATDVASRGLDIQNVEMVINFDIPRNPADYIHRVGRTARAGNAGVAVSILSQYDLELWKMIETHIGLTLDEYPLNGDALSKCFILVNSTKKKTRLKLDEYKLNTGAAVKKITKKRSINPQGNP